MFKFLKSKKGFTLVELMIVVVIMAILVAVAVPIYSAVTSNAKKKTCIANMRQITSQLSNYAMANAKNLSGSFTIAKDGENDAGKVGTVPEGFGVDAATITGMFQTVPYCTLEGTYTVNCSAVTSDVDGGISVQVTCSKGESDGHVYGAAAGE